VIVAIPLFVLAFYGVHRHYRAVSRRLAAGVDAVRRARPDERDDTVRRARPDERDDAVDRSGGTRRFGARR